MKNIKTISFIAMIILAVSCKKNKTTTPVCRVTSIKSDIDSTSINYGSSNKVTHIKNINSDPIEVNMDFVYSGNNLTQTITPGTVSSPVTTINYSLNAAGFAENYNITITNPSSVYVNTYTCKYDTDQHLIWNELIVTKGGAHYISKKDSFVYENGNLVRFYYFDSPIGSGNLRNYTLKSTTAISYSDKKNTAALYINSLYAPNTIIGTSNYYLNNFPYIFHLFGEGSKNLPISSTTVYSSGAAGYTLNYTYTFDADNLVTSQLINRTPVTINYPKKYNFYYECK